MTKIISLAQKMATKYHSEKYFTDHDHKVLSFNRGASFNINAAEVLVSNFINTYGDDGAKKLVEVLKSQGFIDKKVKIKKVA